MTYNDRYLDAAHTNPELQTAADDRPITWQIDRATLTDTLKQIWDQYHNDRDNQ